jgi:hypothetical protein
LYYILSEGRSREAVVRLRKHQCIVLVAFISVIACPERAGSTTLFKLGLEKMSKDAVMVIQGHVAWDYAVQADSQGPIYSITGVEVDKCIAGECPETVVLRHRGGTVGDLTLFIPGMPRFSPGQEVLLFLSPDYEGKPGYHSVLGMGQGFFRVVTEPVSGKRLAIQQLGHATLAAPDAGGSIVPTSTSPLIMELGEIIEAIIRARASEGGVQ